MKRSYKKNTRVRKFNYYDQPRWAAKSGKLSAEIQKYMEIGDTQQHLRMLINFNLLRDTAKHLEDLKKLLNPQP
jgi:hypothetical protein